MPQPADLLRFLQGDSEIKALQAWSRVQQVMRNVGSNHTLVFDDEILHCVIEEMGGWICLCEKTIKEMNFLAHEFKKRYATYLLHPPESYPRQLTGRFEGHNNQLGCTPRSPLLIGDSQKAQQVYQQGRRKGLPTTATKLLSSSENATSSKSLANEALVTTNPILPEEVS